MSFKHTTKHKDNTFGVLKLCEIDPKCNLLGF